MDRKPYPSDITDDEWVFIAPYLTLMTENAPQRDDPLREVFNGLRWIIRTGAQWRMMQGDLPPWSVVYQQTQRWIQAQVFEAIVDDLRTVLRLAAGHAAQPSAVIIDTQTVQSTPESGADAAFDGAKKRRGRKLHLAVDTLGHLLALYVTAADAQDRAQVAELTEQMQGITGGTVEIAFADQGYSGQQAADDAASQGIQRQIVKLADAKHGFVLLPRHWVAPRSIAWMTRFRRLARDYERLPETFAGLHFLAFAILLLQRFVITLGFTT